MSVDQPLAVIGLTNPQSPSNVGSVLRAARCFAADQILFSGTRFERARKFHTDTQAADNPVPLIHCEDFFHAIPEDCAVVCVDLIEGATPLSDFEHPPRALYLFGPEDGSIDQATIDRADHVVYIPTIGCLNLAATANVVLYDRAAKRPKVAVGDDQIRLSRDQNNATRVKKGASEE
ncbi:RNA methyltransferase [Reinekea sp. G2M2-21]|uniref:RNA methyltransferase n=1 Tax=Reinekea sp. G2M2-21 TaxID=2788942 RepID=UPI0018A9D59A|nr:RNA methyltransferase [Reinekea sp. G2M2-21]